MNSNFYYNLNSEANWIQYRRVESPERRRSDQIPPRGVQNRTRAPLRQIDGANTRSIPFFLLAKRRSRFETFVFAANEPE